MHCGEEMPNIKEVVLHPNDESSPLPSPTICSTKSEDMVEDIVEEIVDIVNVTVKFRISDTEMVAQVYPNRMYIGEIRQDIARRFDVSPELLSMKQCNEELSDECLLLETCCDEFGIHEFALELLVERNNSDESLPKLDVNVYNTKHRLPDFINVHIAGEDTEDGNPKDILVEILNRAIEKPFLCGYRDRATGIEYLDAFTQTGPYFDKWKYRRYRSRDTQTFEHKAKLIDTMHDQMSQCFLDGNNVLYVSTATDFTIVPRKYQTYAQKMRLENKLAKIILIQKNWRRYLLVLRIKNAARENRRLVANRLAEEQNYQQEIEKRIKREQRMKQFPRTKDDFDLLFSEVLKWKMAELKRIASMYDGAARIAEVNIVLDKEVQMLNGIERQRTIVYKSMQDFREDQLLKKMGEPISWIGYKDHVIHMDLLRTQRVRFLTEIYKDLRKPLEKEPRMELLRKVKEILITEQDFPEFAELFDLIDREKNLLIYTQFCDVEVLRKRQNLLFLELIKFAKDAPPSKEGKRMCMVCKEVKPFSQFAVRTRQNAVDTCSKCYYLKAPSNDTITYTSILRAIQREERKKRSNASFAFVMQVDDMRYIIDQIWHTHSILSKNGDLSSLRLPRWLKSDDWSPWNCVCLTETEARDHYRIENLEAVYDHKMIQEVGNRHKLARRAFYQLAAVATEFLETGDWWRVGLNKQRTVADTSMIHVRNLKASNGAGDGSSCK